MIEVCIVNGANEVGRNMFAVKIDNTVAIFDMGLQMEEYVQINNDDDIKFVDVDMLKAVGAIPQTKSIDDWKHLTKGIFLSHAHLDHIGAVKYLASEFNCPIYGTPFTIGLLKKILRDDKIRLRNKLVSVKPNSSFKLANLTVEFINARHSTPQTTIIALKTKYGDIVYANEFKLDKTPLLGLRTNIKALKKLKTKLLLEDSLYSHAIGRSGTEKEVKSQLKQLFTQLKSSKKKMFITTFSSHVERLKTIIDLSKILGRKPILLGRSLSKYCLTAQETKIHDFKGVEIVHYSSKIKKKLFNIKKPEKYLFIVTGHQGEENATLTKLITTFEFINKDDIVIFSCGTIPTKTTIEARQKLESRLKQKQVKIYKDIHVSGHAYQDEIKEFLSYVKPEHAIPLHSEMKRMLSYEKVAKEQGVKKIHLLSPGMRLLIK